MVRGNPTQWFKTVTWALVFAYQDRAGVHFLNMLVQIVFSQKTDKKLISFDWLPQGGSQSKEQAHLPLDPPTYLLSLSLSPSPPSGLTGPLEWASICFLGGVGDLGPKGSWVPLKAAIDVFVDVGPLGPRMPWSSLRAAIDFWGSCWPQQPNTKQKTNCQAEEHQC